MFYTKKDLKNLFKKGVYNVNESKKIAKNYIFNMIYQIFILITPLVTTPYISRTLGAEKIGIYSYTLSVATYFMIVGSLGFPLYGQREIAIVAENNEKRSSLFCQIISAQLCLIFITLIVYLFFVIVFLKDNRYMYILQMIGIFGHAFTTNWFYMGIEKFEISVGRNIFVKLFSIVTIFLFVKKPEDVFKYAFIMGLSNVIGNLIALVGIKKYVSFSLNKVSLKKILRHVKPAFILGIPYYITTVYAVIDKTMIGILGSGYQEVGYYEQSQKVIGITLAIVTTISGVLLPRISNEIGKKNKEKIEELLALGINITMMLSMPIMLGLIIIGNMIVPWFFGNGYEKVGLLIQIFSPLSVCIGITNLLVNQYLIALKKEKVLIYIISFCIIINCIGNALLIPYFDSIGVAYATVFSEFIKLIIIILYLTNSISIKNLFKETFKYILSAIIMFTGLEIIKNQFQMENNLYNTLFLIIIGGIVYFLALIIFQDKYMVAFFSNKLNKIVKKINITK